MHRSNCLILLIATTLVHHLYQMSSLITMELCDQNIRNDKITLQIFTNNWTYNIHITLRDIKKQLFRYVIECNNLKQTHHLITFNGSRCSWYYSWYYQNYIPKTFCMKLVTLLFWNQWKILKLEFWILLHSFPDFLKIWCRKQEKKYHVLQGKTK